MDNRSDKKPEKVTQRRLRRYHKAQARKAAEARADSQFFRAVFSLAGVGAALAIGLAVFGMTGGSFDPYAMEGLLAPWLGPLSKLEVIGLGFVALIGGLYFWRIRKR